MGRCGKDMNLGAIARGSVDPYSFWPPQALHLSSLEPALTLLTCNGFKGNQGLACHSDLSPSSALVDIRIGCRLILGGSKLDGVEAGG